ncbi:MAG: hypothetical protein ACK559_35450, partial [bacterium]
NSTTGNSCEERERPTRCVVPLRESRDQKHHPRSDQPPCAFAEFRDPLQHSNIFQSLLMRPTRNFLIDEEMRGYNNKKRRERSHPMHPTNDHFNALHDAPSVVQIQARSWPTHRMRE